ncbi:MAG: SET domain-containing protein-lysine N-methyltransferase [Candidatus Aenigmarchaeota archaeon]|nr:SET domain-containing protein-lysine N-methyltransferase [Candidatus Aenigmarchaeota archaeon]
MAIKSYRSPKTEVRNSKTEGRGLFAKEDIKKDEIVFIKSGHIVDLKEHENLEKKLGEYCLQISDNFFLCPKTKKEVKDTAIFINHSCNPNVGPNGQITFVAIRNIMSGEELCYDYAMTTAYKYKLRCNCGSKNCRKMITGNDWKLKALQGRYGNHFTYNILKKMKSIK